MIRKLFLITALALGIVATGQAQQEERFSIATLNIDGLPQKILVFNVNADGPGSAGTVRIGKYLMQKRYDLMFFQEDFNYHEELTAMLEDNYQLDTWSGDVGLEGHKVDLLHAQNVCFECDGLMGCWKKGITATSGQRTAWTDAFGKFSHAGDMLATKGFRRYEVTLATGTRLVVYNLHMDAEDRADAADGKAIPDREARVSQLKQLRDDIMARLDERPVIVLGDFNSLYYRDKTKETFVDFFNTSDRATISDVWVELRNNGQFPEYQEDCRIVDENQEKADAESLDKIFYINPTNSPYSLKAITYSRDTDGYKRNGKAMGDHYPVAVTFEVKDSSRPNIINAIESDLQSEEAKEYYNISGQRVNQPAGGLYIEQDSKGTRKRIVK